MYWLLRSSDSHTAVDELDEWQVPNTHVQVWGRRDIREKRRKCKSKQNTIIQFTYIACTLELHHLFLRGVYRSNNHYCGNVVSKNLVFQAKLILVSFQMCSPCFIKGSQMMEMYKDESVFSTDEPSEACHSN